MARLKIGDALTLLAVISLAPLSAVIHGAEPGLLRARAEVWVWIGFALWGVWRALGYIAGLSPLSPALRRLVGVGVPLLFAAWVLFLWQILAVGLRAPAVLLPPPSRIFAALTDNRDILAGDFVQTFVRAVMPGFLIGSASGLAVALAAWRLPFLRRGLLPLGNLMAAMPIIGIAPIMVMWFGFDWQSKAAVAAVMTFFPMFINAVAGLDAAAAELRDLLGTYAAGGRARLVKLHLPGALPFVFNALKLNSTLALIGAIVAEFFGTPITGMGFRISAEIGRMNLEMVWASIAVAAAAGSAAYGGLAAAERALTFWHPSYRR